MHQPGSAPRRRLWPVFVPLAFVVVLALGWSGFWFLAAGAAETRIAGWREREANSGRFYNCERQTVGGFPFRIEVRCIDPSIELRRNEPPVALKATDLDDKVREEIDELTEMLRGNLEKVVQHGKRADSIVKNMLLHSREGSGEHRPVDINAIVEESLNLAYHGARAEKSGFNITLQRDLDPDAGLIDLYPQEITRVFLNLISNGFYAATKRKEAGEESFEPTLSASTKSLGNRVEIRIRDNGTGIPLEVKEKMFNPFFTTKPAGEGTGLGLSMSHDIVVKQHGGKIDVDTKPGVFTEFIITLPRTGAAQAQAGGKN